MKLNSIFKKKQTNKMVLSYHPYVLPIASGEQTEPELFVLHAVSHEAPEAPRIHFLEPTTAVISPANNIQLVNCISY